MAGTTLGQRVQHTGHRQVALLVAVALAVALLSAGVGLGPAVAEDPEVEAEFEAIGSEGFVEINSTEQESPIQFPTPDEVDDPISITGEIYEDGTWSSTDVTFPLLDADEMDVPVDIELEAVGDFTGEIDRETGVMTVDGTLNIIVPAADAQIEVTAALTTEQSNEMEGSAGGLDTESAQVTVVDNEFTIDQPTGVAFIDGFIGLPSTRPGTNWFSLTLDMDIQDPDADPGEEDPGIVSGVVTDDEGNPVEGATVTIGDAETTTDETGAYEVEAPGGTQDVTVEADGFETASESVGVTGDGVQDFDLTLDLEDPGEAEFVASSISTDDVDVGETVVVEAVVTNAGDAFGERDVTLSVGDQSEDFTVSLEPLEQETVTLEWETTEADEGDHEALLDTGDDSVSTIVIVGDVEIDVAEADFIAHSTGGYITFDYEDYDEILGAFDIDVDSVGSHEDIRAVLDEADGTPGLSLPDVNRGEEPIVLAGAIDEETGTWELVDAFFPALEDPNYPFDGFIELVDGGEPAPLNMHGEVDFEEGLLTAVTEFKVYVDGREDATFTFEIEMTTGESGDIPTGMADIGPDRDDGAIHLVSNTFPVFDQTGDGLIDAEMSLPSEDPSANYLELGFDINFDPTEEDLEGIQDAEEIRDTRDLEATSPFVTGGQGIGLLGLLVAALFTGAILYGRVNGRTE